MLEELEEPEEPEEPEEHEEHEEPEEHEEFDCRSRKLLAVANTQRKADLDTINQEILSQMYSPL